MLYRDSECNIVLRPQYFATWQRRFIGRGTSGVGQKQTSDCATVMSALASSTDIFSPTCHVRKAPTGDINCRDCGVPSLAEPEPDRQVFAKFKHLLRKAAARSAETNCVTIGEILRAFTPTEWANYFRNSRYAQF